MADDSDEEPQLDLPDLTQNPEALLLAAEDRALVTRALNELPVEYRQILTMRAINDMTYAEICEVLKLREGTVKSRLSRARMALRNNLLQFGNKSDAKASILTRRRDAQ